MHPLSSLLVHLHVSPTSHTPFHPHRPAPQFCQAASYLEVLGQPVVIPEPAVLKPVRLWTGKQLFTLLLHPNEKDGVRVNVEFKVGDCGLLCLCV